MSESVDHNISVFIWKIGIIVIYIITKCSSFNKRDHNKNAEK